MARDLGLLMGSCLRGARCAPTKTQSRVEISPVGAILTRQPPEPVRPAWRRHCWRGHSRASTGSSGSTHCDAARASRRRNTAAGRRTEQACSARQRRVGGPERACGARQRRVGRPERKVCTRQRWVDNPSAPAARGGSATRARLRRKTAAGRRGRASALPPGGGATREGHGVRPSRLTAPRAKSRRRRRGRRGGRERSRSDQARPGRWSERAWRPAAPAGGGPAERRTRGGCVAAAFNRKRRALAWRPGNYARHVH